MDWVGLSELCHSTTRGFSQAARVKLKEYRECAGNSRSFTHQELFELQVVNSKWASLAQNIILSRNMGKETDVLVESRSKVRLSQNSETSKRLPTFPISNDRDLPCVFVTQELLLLYHTPVICSEEPREVQYSPAILSLTFSYDLTTRNISTSANNHATRPTNTEPITIQ